VVEIRGVGHAPTLLHPEQIAIVLEFLFEGAILGFIGSLLASLVIYVIYYLAFYQLQLRFYYVFNFSPSYINGTMVMVIVGGSLIGLLGSYLSTRKMIKHA
jgi:cell division protein FtsX